MHLTCCEPLLCRMAAGCLQHSSSAGWLHPLQEHLACIAEAVVPGLDLLKRETAHQVCCRRFVEQQQSNSVPVKQDAGCGPCHMACALALPALAALGTAGNEAGNQTSR